MRRRSRTVLFALVMGLAAGIAISTMLHQVRRITPPIAFQPKDNSIGSPKPLQAEPASNKQATPERAQPDAPEQPPPHEDDSEQVVETVTPPRQVDTGRGVHTLGFPPARMRLARPDNPNVFIPDELYTQHRIVLSRVNVTAPYMSGMQVSGRIFTDFVADKIPRGHNLPAGQLTGLRIEVQLYAVDTVLKWNTDWTEPLQPRLDPKNPGRPVPGQSVRVTVNAHEGDFGLAEFTLPALEKPLPPGVYRLQANLRFQAQDSAIRNAIKWCSDLYGARSTYDEDTFETVFEPVMGNAYLHEEVYRYLVQQIGGVTSDAVIYIGETLEGGVVRAIPPERHDANIVVHDYHHMIASQVSEYEHQLDNVDEVLNSEFDARRQLKGADPAMMERWRREVAEDRRRIVRDNLDLFDRYGGRLDESERTMLDRNERAFKRVLRQIADFQDGLTYQYWVMLDGLLTYSGWHTMNVVAYNAWEAVTRNDAKLSATRRKEELDGVGGLSERWDQRRRLWRFFAPEATKLAFEYLRVKEETNTWDADKFTTTVAGKVQLDVEAWRMFVTNHLAQFLLDLRDHLDLVTTTDDYAMQVWPDVMSQAMSAGETVVTSALSWEFLIRNKQQEELDSAIIADWENEVPSRTWLYTPERIKAGQKVPGRLKLEFDKHISDAKVDLNLLEFQVRYRRALEAEYPDRNNLPGQRRSRD